MAAKSSNARAAVAQPRDRPPLPAPAGREVPDQPGAGLVSGHHHECVVRLPEPPVVPFPLVGLMTSVHVEGRESRGEGGVQIGAGLGRQADGDDFAGHGLPLDLRSGGR
ncbi:hypothetical protein AMK32_08235 [Streptomyces sp. CB01883]|nr:hypothetical protein AMK32_08235 [Streptomyces sp. CB01883]